MTKTEQALNKIKSALQHIEKVESDLGWTEDSKAAIAALNESLAALQSANEPEIGCSHCGWEGALSETRTVVPLGHPIAHQECPKCGKFCTTFYMTLEPRAALTAASAEAQPSQEQQHDKCEACDGKRGSYTGYGVWKFCSRCKGTGLTSTQPVASHPQPSAPVAQALTDEQIDKHLEKVLRASGSSLRHYTLPKSLTDMRKAMREVLSTAPQVEAKEGWISVKDRLPDANGWYAVLLSDPENIGWDTNVWWRALFHKERDHDRWNSCDPIEDGQPVTHWCALPAAPSQKEGEQPK